MRVAIGNSLENLIAEQIISLAWAASQYRCVAGGDEETDGFLRQNEVGKDDPFTSFDIALADAKELFDFLDELKWILILSVFIALQLAYHINAQETRHLSEAKLKYFFAEKFQTGTYRRGISFKRLRKRDATNSLWS